MTNRFLEVEEIQDVSEQPTNMFFVDKEKEKEEEEDTDIDKGGKTQA